MNRFKLATATVRLWFSPERMEAEGETPDYRFSLANERTFLAWIRTAFALVGGGFAVDQFLPETGWAPMRTVLAMVLLLGGVACAVRAINHWARSELAMRRKEDMAYSRFPALLASAVVLIALALLVLVALGSAR